jgi:hypothetical protein
VDYRPRTNTVILLDMGHTLKGEHIQEEQGRVGKSKPMENKKGSSKVFFLQKNEVFFERI